ncbi:MAG: class I SAM-dependent methyltransferase [Treponemataceae bacterium]|nr:class I SAM-dependent methyltransferase [Treponemataceae bacterium]
MAQQNIYDNQTFFEGYKKIRENEVNANNLFEIPALFSMMPNLNDKIILDLGCGFGDHCKRFVESGAKKVIGIDISEKMLEIAKQENADSKITYINMPMENISKLNDKFDIVVSSLAFHYVQDFSGVVKNIFDMLNENGVFLFSQENPLCTCFSGGNRWTKDENGNKLYINLSNYGIEGERESTWFVDNVKKYHRTFSTIINTLIETGFTIEKMIEPLPTEDLLKKYPEYKDLFHKPDFLLVKVRK